MVRSSAQPHSISLKPRPIDAIPAHHPWSAEAPTAYLPNPPALTVHESARGDDPDGQHDANVDAKVDPHRNLASSGKLNIAVVETFAEGVEAL